MHHVDHNELWILGKEFGPLDLYRSTPQEHHKNWVSNCDLELCTEINLNENSLLWNFQIFSLFLSYDTAMVKACLWHHSYTLTDSRCSKYSIGATIISVYMMHLVQSKKRLNTWWPSLKSCKTSIHWLIDLHSFLEQILFIILQRISYISSYNIYLFSHRNINI